MNTRTLWRQAHCVGLLSFVLTAVSSPVLGQNLGFWEPALTWTIGGDSLVAQHAVHLPDGRILVWDNVQINGTPVVPHLWHPINLSLTATTLQGLSWPGLGCSGHAALDDGSVLVVGGGSGGDDGSLETTIVVGAEWQPQTVTMEFERFYPTCTKLSDGRILVSGGTDGDVNGDAQAVLELEIYDPNALPTERWETILPDGMLGLRAYPHMFLLPTGEIFFTPYGCATNSYKIDLDMQPPLAWGPPVSTTSVSHFRGSAVMYEPGKILISGGERQVPGGRCGQQTITGKETERIDLTAADPQWETDDLWDMRQRRFDHNLVLLPNGMVLAIGGENFDDMGMLEFVFHAEWVDPRATILNWVQLADMDQEAPRADHSTAVLLPSGKVLVAGGDDFAKFKEAQIFNPPYGAGPVPFIIVAPSVIRHPATEFTVTLETAPVGTLKVTLIRLASVTHSFDHEQRFQELFNDSVPGGSNTFTVTAPADANEAPLGTYMLFVVLDGVPSIAKYVFVTCLKDIDGGGTVGITDFLALLGAWGPNPGHPADYDGDGIVGIVDFLDLLAAWGPCPGSTLSSPSLNDELLDACLTQEDWDEYEDVMTDEASSQAKKDRYDCWMKHYINDCNKCQCPRGGHSGCPQPDPFL